MSHTAQLRLDRSLQHFTRSTSEAIIFTLPFDHIHSAKRILLEAMALAITFSHQIFLGHEESEWNPSSNCPLCTSSQCSIVIYVPPLATESLINGVHMCQRSHTQMLL